MSNAQWVGIDVSKARLDISLRPSQQKIQVPNTPEGIAKLWDQLSLFTIEQMIIEATGGFEQAVALDLDHRGLTVSVINPRQGRDSAKATEKLAKTDAIDAEVLAHFWEALKPSATVFASQSEEELQALISRRRQLMEMLRRRGESGGFGVVVRQSRRSYLWGRWLRFDLIRASKHFTIA